MAVALAPSVITRSADHKYTYDGRTYPGVTSILRVLDKSDALMAWAARNTAEAAVAQIGALPSLLATVGPEGVVRALTARSGWKRDEAANLGTEIHRLADLVVTAQPTPSMEEPVRKRVLLYADWWKASGWTLRTSEAMVVNPESQYGGTIDLLARDRDGRTVLADIKTGKAVYRETALQLTAYGMAKLIQTNGKVFGMPTIDRYAVLHVTADEVREVEVPVGELEVLTFLGIRDAYDWFESTKGKRL